MNSVYTYDVQGIDLWDKAKNFFSGKKETVKNAVQNPVQTVKNIVAKTPTSYNAESFPLAKGMQGENIKLLQTALGIEADGKFWTATENKLNELYGTTTCSEELFKQITQQQSKNNKGMKLNLSDRTKKILKGVGIVAAVAGVGVLGYQLLKPKKEVSGGKSKSKETKALNGVKKGKNKRKSQKSKSKKENVSKKLLALK